MTDGGRDSLDTEVLIVGAGPTGLVLACELARRQVAFRLVDSAASPSEHSKALGVMSRTLEVLEGLDVSERMVKGGVQVREVRMWSDAREVTRFRIDVLEAETRYPYLLILPQGDTERILLERLADLGSIVERRKKLVALETDEAGATATVEHVDGATETIRARWVVGCDGAHSAVRHAVGMPFEGRAYEEGFLLADVAIEWGKDPGMIHTALGPAGAGAAMPLPGGRHHRLIFPIGPAGEVPPTGKLATPTLDEIRAHLHQRLDPDAKIREAIWISAFRVHRRIVPSLRRGRAFVAGDAAHIHSPAGAQGMNLGVQDAHNLAWKLALVVGGAAADERALLDSYDAERRPVAQATLGGTGAAQFLLALKNPVAKAVRNACIRFVTRRRFVMRRLLTSLLEVGVRYGESPIVAGRGAGTRPKNASALVRSGNHAVLVPRGAAPAEFERALAAFASRVEVRANDDASARDTIVVRPDGYVGFRAPGAAATAALAHLARTLKR